MIAWTPELAISAVSITIGGLGLLARLWRPSTPDGERRSKPKDGELERPKRELPPKVERKGPKYHCVSKDSISPVFLEEKTKTTSIDGFNDFIKKAGPGVISTPAQMVALQDIAEGEVGQMLQENSSRYCRYNCGRYAFQAGLCRFCCPEPGGDYFG